MSAEARIKFEIGSLSVCLRKKAEASLEDLRYIQDCKLLK